MMNLRNMITGLSSDTVAQRLIQLWEHDEGTLQFWRASSNFVYVFEHNHEKYFLRFAYEQENNMKNIIAELDFMNFLRSHEFPCVSPIASKTDKLIETVTTSDGLYYAVVFSAAKGIPLNDSLMEMQSEDWGRSLATLHMLSKLYKPVEFRRKSWQDILHDIESVLRKHPQEHEAMEELKRVTRWLQSLPASEDSYGLIHYDFQLDNVFYDESKQGFEVIDFDDAMYHWYAMDIVTTLADLYDTHDSPSAQCIQAFLGGYRSIMTVDDESLSLFPKFKRFDNLYGFSRLLWSLENSDVMIVDAPSWYEGLKEKLNRMIENRRQGFREPW